jgi:hypothetical protein
LRFESFGESFGAIHSDEAAELTLKKRGRLPQTIPSLAVQSFRGLSGFKSIK